MGTFFKIVLPLSKAALASIGLMYAVQFWNDYTNFKIYINKNELFNFQMKLRNMVMDNDIPDEGGIDPNTIANAAVIVAILPFCRICGSLFVYSVIGIPIEHFFCRFLQYSALICRKKQKGHVY